MKRLISAQMVKQANKDGKKELIAPVKSTIITAEAKELAEKYGIRFVESGINEVKSNVEIDESTVQLIIKEVLKRLPPEKRDPAIIADAVMQVLSNYKN